MSEDREYEHIEVQVSRKIGVNLSLDDLLSGLSQQAQTIASSAHGAHAQVAQHLNRLGQLVEDLKGEVSQMGHLDPNILHRLQRGTSPDKPGGPPGGS